MVVDGRQARKDLSQLIEDFPNVSKDAEYSKRGHIENVRAFVKMSMDSYGIDRSWIDEKCEKCELDFLQFGLGMMIAALMFAMTAALMFLVGLLVSP